LKVLNKDHIDHSYQVSVRGIPGLRLKEEKEITVQMGHVEEDTISVLIDPADMTVLSADIEIQVTANGDQSLSATSIARFLKPR
jgi:hypothetical protein